MRPEYVRSSPTLLLSLLTISMTATGCATSHSAPPDLDPSVELDVAMLTHADVGALLVIDRSGSMESPITLESPDGPTRWQALHDALATTALAAPDVWFGAQVFPDEALPTDEDPTRFCTLTEGALAVPPVTGGLSEIAAHLREGPAPRGGTPTAAAIRAATASLDGGGGARWALLLVTDGAPNCADDVPLDRCVCSTEASACTGANSLLCIDDAGTVDAVRDARDRGVPTMVIGFTDPERPELDGVLAAIAEAGRPSNRGPAMLRTVTSESDLYDALDAAAASLSACTYLAPTGTPEAVVAIEIDGVTIEPSTVDGWSPSRLWPDAITLNGAACDAAVGRTVSASSMVR